MRDAMTASQWYHGFRRMVYDARFAGPVGNPP